MVRRLVSSVLALALVSAVSDKSQYLPGTLCWIKVPSNSSDVDLYGQFVLITKRFENDNGRASWEITPNIYSKRLNGGVGRVYEDTLVPCYGPMKVDVRDTLQVMAMINSKSFMALSDLAKKVVKGDDYPDAKKGDE